MQILAGNDDEGKASFAQAIAIDSSLDLDPAYKNPQLEGVWNDVKKKGPPPDGGGGRRPSTAGPQPSGDFAHTPAPGSARPHAAPGLRRVLRQRAARARHREVQGLRA